MKEKNTIKLEAIRDIKSGIDKLKSGSTEITDEEILKVIRTTAKQRYETLDYSIKADNQDEITKNSAILYAINSYLPAEMDDTTLDAIINDTIDLLGKDMGTVMKTIKEAVESQGFNYNGRAVSEKVRIAFSKV